DLSAPHRNLRFMLPSAEAFAAAMGRFGVGEKSRVILYSTTTPQWATRIWWMLRNYGFDNAAVLNGGFQKWAREGRPVQTGPALRRRHRGERRRAGARHARPPRCAALRRLDVGMGQRPGPADGARLDNR